MDIGPDVRPRAIVADKGYDSAGNRQLARKRGALTVIPYRKNIKNRPKRFASALYRGRARIEQAVGKLKRFKRIALRCEKTATNFSSFVALAAAFILIKSVHRTYYRKNKGAAVIGKIETIRKYNERAGHVATVLQGNGQACIYGRVAFLSAGKSNPRPDERFDTYVDLGNCAKGWTLEKLASWLRTVNIRPAAGGKTPEA